MHRLGELVQQLTLPKEQIRCEEYETDSGAARQHGRPFTQRAGKRDDQLI